MTETHRSHRFSERLDIEWHATATSRRTIRTIRTWAPHATLEAHRRLLRDATDANQIIAATHRDAGDGADELLAVLVGLAQDDELAGRLVIQRLLPGIISTAAKYRFLTNGADPVAEAVGAAWIALRSYDISRRTSHIAAALISDTIYLAFRRRARQQLPDETSTAPHLLGERVEAAPPSALVELADVVRTARDAGVSSGDLDLVRALIRSGSPSAAARQQCVTPRTIRNRRDRTIEQLRAVVAVAA